MWLHVHSPSLKPEEDEGTQRKQIIKHFSLLQPAAANQFDRSSRPLSLPLRRLLLLNTPQGKKKVQKI
jgi:hypothetical protein